MTTKLIYASSNGSTINGQISTRVPATPTLDQRQPDIHWIAAEPVWSRSHERRRRLERHGCRARSFEDPQSRERDSDPQGDKSDPRDPDDHGQVWQLGRYRQNALHRDAHEIHEHKHPWHRNVHHGMNGSLFLRSASAPRLGRPASGKKAPQQRGNQYCRQRDQSAGHRSPSMSVKNNLEDFFAKRTATRVIRKQKNRHNSSRRGREVFFSHEPTPADFPRHQPDSRKVPATLVD